MNKSRYPFYLFLVLLATSSCVESKRPHEVSIDHRIFDSARLLSKAQKDSIFQQIIALEKNIGSQIGIITLDTLVGQSINEYSFRQAEKLKFGRAKFDDGILITVVIKNRQMRIEVGYGLEKIIKDEIASRINRNVIAPRFREGRYGKGLYNAVDSIKSLIEIHKELVGQRP